MSSLGSLIKVSRIFYCRFWLRADCRTTLNLQPWTKVHTYVQRNVEWDEDVTGELLAVAWHLIIINERRSKLICTQSLCFLNYLLARETHSPFVQKHTWSNNHHILLCSCWSNKVKRMSGIRKFTFYGCVTGLRVINHQPFWLSRLDMLDRPIRQLVKMSTLFNKQAGQEMRKKKRKWTREK
jgi:hypothetical protein